MPDPSHDHPVSRPPETFQYACAFGAQPVEPSLVRFSIWAPDARSVSLHTDAGEQPMTRSADGVFSTTASVPAGNGYRYRIDDAHDVPDPAARAQRDDITGPSVVIDPSAYRWRHPQWLGRPWQEAVICEVHVGAMGGFDGVRSQLERLAAVGYTAIELMPIGEFPGARNWGYDGVLPYAVEASYGSPEALKALIDEAHGLGLMVLLDVVYNHFGPDGNYLGQYASGFFRDDIHTPWGAAIDFRQHAVKRFFIDNALMWVEEYRFDGLRFDAVHAIEPPSFLHELSAAIRAQCDPQRHVHLILENEHNAAHLLRSDFDAQWNDDFHNTLHALLTGEREGYYADFAGDATAKLATVLREGFLFQGQPDSRGKPRGEPSAELSPQAFVIFSQNHDQIGNRPMGERLISLVDHDVLRAAMALTALTPMVPMFFMGEEFGCRTPFLFFTSHHGELAQRVRDGRRAEFAHFAGFSDPALREGIPDPNAPDTFDASIPRRGDDVDEWSGWFQSLLRARRQHLVDAIPGARSLGCQVLAPGALIARWQLGDDRILELRINLSASPVASEDRSNDGEVIFAWPEDAAGTLSQGQLEAASLVALVEESAP